ASEREDREELRFEPEKNRDRSIRLPIIEEPIGPGELYEHGAGRCERDEVIPALSQGDSRDPDIQNRDVTEERGRIIDTGREKDRGKKSAEQTEHDDHLRVHADREEERRRGDDRHRSERGNEGDQMVEDVRRKNISVENQNTGRAKTLPRDAIASCCGKPAGDDEADPQYRPDR